MSYIQPFIGGVLIGLASTLLLLTQGRLAGISGIIGGFFKSSCDNRSWRIVFLLGLILGGFVFQDFYPSFKISNLGISSPLEAILGGLLVGFGTRLGGGCTSGHGICGIPRLSIRSIVATCLFMFFAGLVVYLRSL